MAVTIRIAASAAVLAIMSAPAATQVPSFAGKNVQVILGFAPGTANDLWGRLVARHIGKHLLGRPAVVPQNMPGAGSFIAANHIYNIAPRDGTAMGLIAGPAILGPLTGASGARFGPTRMTWLGTPTMDTSVCVAYNSPAVKVRTLKDIYEKELHVGSVGTGNQAYSYPKALNALLGMKFKVILGFPSSSAIFLAMERGELDGICQSLAGISENRPDWITGNKLMILFQGGAAPNPVLKDVPFVNDLARTPEDRQAIEFLYAGNGFGRPFIAPPGIPAEQATLLQDAFMATMKDPDFLADAKKQKLAVAPEHGEHLAALVKKTYATPKSIVAKVADVMK